MPDRSSQDEDSAEDEVPKVKASIHSDEPSEEETEDEEDEETSNFSHPHQLVRSRRSPLILLPTTHLCRLHSIHPKSHVSQTPPLSPISG